MKKAQDWGRSFAVQFVPGTTAAALNLKRLGDLFIDTSSSTSSDCPCKQSSCQDCSTDWGRNPSCLVWQRDMTTHLCSRGLRMFLLDQKLPVGLGRRVPRPHSNRSMIQQQH